MDGLVTIWNVLKAIFPVALFIYVFFISLDKHLNKIDNLLPTKVKDNKAGLIGIMHTAIYLIIVLIWFKLVY